MADLNERSSQLQILFDAALEEMDQGHWADALVHLDQALGLDSLRTGLRFNRAWCRMQLGQLQGAQDDLESLLDLQSDHSQALAWLGRVQLARGHLRDGAVNLTRAQRLEPDNAQLAKHAIESWLVVPDATQSLLECALEVAQRGLLGEADFQRLLPFVGASSDEQRLLRSWLTALCQMPHGLVREWMFEAWCSHCEIGHDHVELAVAARLWLARFQDSTPALDRLIMALAARGDLDAALPLALERARQHPEQAEHTKALVQHLLATKNRASTLSAVTLLSHAISREPDNAMLWCIRGDINCQFFLKEDAESDYRQALLIDPGHAMAHAGLAETLSQHGRFDEALALLREHEWAESDRGLVLHTLGAVLRRAGRLEQARETLEHLWQSTGHPVAAFNLAFCLLALGDYPRGFALFAHRRDAGWANRIGHRAQAMGARLWAGDMQALQDRHLLVTTENGIGDTFHFARYLPRLVAVAGRVTVVAQIRTERLLQSVDPALQVISERGPVPVSDWVCDIMDLPGLLGAHLHQPETLCQAHCMSPDPEIVQRIRDQLGPARGLRVALGWTGTRSTIAERSIPLHLFTQFEWQGIEWFSLQYDDLLPEDQAAARLLGLRQEKWSFDEAAAAMTLMDAVVSIDTVYAHLAGALGLSPWVLVNAQVDWRWQDMGGANAWYPKARLLRAAKLDDWTSVLHPLHDALSAMVAQGLTHAPCPGPLPAPVICADPAPSWFDQLNAAAGQMDWRKASDAFVLGLLEEEGSAWLIRALNLMLPHVEGSHALLRPMMDRLTRRWPSTEDVPFEELMAIGLVVLHARRPQEALSMAILAVQKMPNDVRGWAQLAMAYKLVNDPQGHLRAVRRLLALDPSFKGAQWFTQHHRLLSGQLEDVLAVAQADCQAARESGDQQTLIDALLWRAATWLAMVRLDLAALDFREVLSLQPDHPQAHCSLGEVLALQGDYLQAAPHVLKRLTNRSAVGGLKRLASDKGVPEWVGGPLSDWHGRHLVVLGNNGAGDTFQFARFLLYMAKQGVRVSLCYLRHHGVVVPSLQALAKEAGVALSCLVFSDDHLPAGADGIVQLESLPWLLGVTPDKLPDWPAHFLRVPVARQLQVAERMGWHVAPRTRLRVGLAWLGQSSGDGIRRTELSQVAEAFTAEGVIGWVDLYGLPIEDLTHEEHQAAQQLGMVHPQWSFEDEAAALRQMDLVISIDTSHAHLAGALGVPCWVLLKRVPDWRWGISGEVTPWYPHARLFRQAMPNDWQQPLRQVARALRQLAPAPGRGAGKSDVVGDQIPL